MSTYVPLPIVPAPIPEEKFAHTNDMNTGQSLRRVAAGYNYVSANQRKQFVAHCNYGPATPGTSNELIHYFVFRTGENVDSVDCLLGMLPASPGNTLSAYCQMVLYDGTNTLSSDKMYYALKNGASAHAQYSRVSITVAGHTLLPNTKYRGYIKQANFARVKNLAVFETSGSITDSTVTGVCDPLNWETHKPITDAGVQDLAETGTALFRHNGLHLINWVRHTQATAPTVSTTTPVNILDTSVTAWAATSPGFVLNTEYLGSHNADVKVELGVLANRTVGTTDTYSVTVIRNGGTVLTASGLTGGTAPYDASTHSFTARASDKVDVMIATSGTDTWRLDALGLWLYEA